MKTRYNLSKIMKLANHMMKYEGFNRSDALKLAWVLLIITHQNKAVLIQEINIQSAYQGIYDKFKIYPN